jgi:hypothetical protein
MHKGTALVVCATGVAGRSLLGHVLASGECGVIAVSRRKLDVPDRDGGDFSSLPVLPRSFECRTL